MTEAKLARLAPRGRDRHAEGAAFREQMLRSLPRLLHFGIAYADAADALARSTDADAWARQLVARADYFEELGDQACTERRWATAAELWRHAIDYCHFAAFKLQPDAPQRSALQNRCRRLYACLAPLLKPPALPLTIPCCDEVLCGYVRGAGRREPLVILINGLDSCSEVELHHFGEYFLKRGAAVAVLDGPSQGARPKPGGLQKFEHGMTSVVSFLQRSYSPRGIGVFGVSLGGYLACRVAAADHRIAGCVSLGGFHDARVLPRLTPVGRKLFRRAFGLNGDAAGGRSASLVSLATCAQPIRCQLLVVHGTEDHLVDSRQVEALAAWAGDLAEVWKVEGGEHVCTNRFAECLPRVADWLVARLDLHSSPGEREWRPDGSSI